MNKRHPSEDMARIIIRMPRSLHRKLKKVSKAQERTMTAQAVMILREGLKKYDRVA